MTSFGPPLTPTETFAEKVERLRPERETEPEGCSHCRSEGRALTNYSRPYGGNVGGHWLCALCAVTQSASRLGAGLARSDDVADVAAMLWLVLDLVAK
jgi:hypothetical protein